MNRHLRLAGIMVVGVMCGLGLAAPASGMAAVPGSLAALGDSFTAAGYSGGPGCTATGACPANSWATGTNPAVDSHYRRLLVLNPAISGRATNFAVSAKKVEVLDSQAANAVGRGAEYVTVFIGLNDLCRETEAGMTPVATFRTQFQTALNRLRSGLPNARVLVASVPDPYRLWQLHKGNPAARDQWAARQICQAMLADPLSTEPADVARRDRVRQRGADFSRQLRELCATWTQCRYDGDAIAARWNWTVSPTDHFHPSPAGQQQLAQLLWDAGHDFAGNAPGPGPVAGPGSGSGSGSTTAPTAAPISPGAPGASGPLGAAGGDSAGPSGATSVAPALERLLRRAAADARGRGVRGLLRTRRVTARADGLAGGVVTLRLTTRGGRVIAAGRATVRDGRSVTVTLRLGARGRTRLRQLQRPRLVLRATHVTASGRRTAAARTVILTSRREATR